MTPVLTASFISPLVNSLVRLCTMSRIFSLLNEIGRVERRVMACRRKSLVLFSRNFMTSSSSSSSKRMASFVCDTAISSRAGEPLSGACAMRLFAPSSSTPPKISDGFHAPGSAYLPSILEERETANFRPPFFKTPAHPSMLLPPMSVGPSFRYHFCPLKSVSHSASVVGRICVPLYVRISGAGQQTPAGDQTCTSTRGIPDGLFRPFLDAPPQI